MIKFASRTSVYSRAQIVPKPANGRPEGVIVAQRAAIPVASDAWQVWARRLVAPHPAITDPDFRRLASLHSSLLLVLLVIAFPVLVAEEASHQFAFRMDAGHAVLWLGYGVLVLAYPLSRSRHHTASATLTVVTTAALVWRLWAVGVRDDPTRGTLYFIAVPLILAAILLPLWLSGLFLAVSLASLQLVPWFAAWLGARVPGTLVFDVTSFALCVFGLTFAGALLLENSRRQLARQSRVLSEKSAALEEANARLRALESTRIQFLNQVAHDLASPLTPVKIQMELIRIMTEGKTEPAVAEAVRVVNRNMGLFERLLGDIRDLARMDAGKLKLEKAPTDLGRVVEDVRAVYDPIAKTGGVRIESRVDPGHRVLADEKRLHQILNNLVSNAVKFTPPAGEVKIESVSEGPQIAVAVRDTGRGLTVPEMARLFQPFSQVHRPGEVKERGTGLGLYICKGFVEAHGGRIWVESDGRGKGSRFLFTLPRAGNP